MEIFLLNLGLRLVKPLFHDVKWVELILQMVVMSWAIVHYVSDIFNYISCSLVQFRMSDVL